MNTLVYALFNDMGFLLVAVALLVVVLLPWLSERFGFADELEYQRRLTALHYGLNLEAMSAHEFRAEKWQSSLFLKAECPVCLEQGKVSWSLLVGRAGQKCGHFFCLDCAEKLAQHQPGKCAICRAEFIRLAPIPNPDRDPSGWFDAVDIDCNGYLDKYAVVNVLKMLLPASEHSGETFEMVEGL
jgi:hypothetical protein